MFHTQSDVSRSLRTFAWEASSMLATSFGYRNFCGADIQSHLWNYNATSVSPWFDDDVNLLGAIAVKCDEMPQISCLFRNVFNTNHTWQNDRIWRLFLFWFHQKSFTTMCELLWMPTTEWILSSRLWSVPPCRLRPPVLSDHICLAHWVVVIYRFYCSCGWSPM